MEGHGQSCEVIPSYLVIGLGLMLIKLKTYGRDLRGEGLGMFLRILAGRCPFKGPSGATDPTPTDNVDYFPQYHV